MDDFTLDEINSIFAKWIALECMFKDVNPEHRNFIIMALENQRIYNESIIANNFDTWKRNSIPLVRRLIDSLLKENKIKLNFSFTKKFGKYTDTGLSWDLYSEHNRAIWEKHNLKLDYECAFLQSFIEKIKNFIYTKVEQEKITEINFRGFGCFSSNQVIIYADFIKEDNKDYSWSES